MVASIKSTSEVSFCVLQALLSSRLQFLTKTLDLEATLTQQRVVRLQWEKNIEPTLVATDVWSQRGYWSYRGKLEDSGLLAKLIASMLGNGEDDREPLSPSTRAFPGTQHL